MPPKIKYFFLDYHSVLNQGQYCPPTPKWYSAVSGDSFDCQDKKNTCLLYTSDAADDWLVV